MVCNPLIAPTSCSADLAVKTVTSGKNAVEAAGQSAMQGLANAFYDAAAWAVKNLTAAWLNAPAPDVSSPGSVSVWLGQRLTFFVAAAMVAAFLVAAYRLATATKAENVRDLGESLVRVILTTTVAGVLITTAVQAGEIFSDWIIEQADLDLRGSLLFSSTQAAAMSAAFLFVMSAVMLVAQIIQVVLMLARNAMIIYLAAVLPIAAAASTTAAGKQWWSKSIAWLIAFVLYKPVAALIYAGAFKLLSGDRSILDQVTGVMAVVLAIFALPAMMRFLVPATAAMASGNAGAMAVGAVGATVATGAVMTSGGGAALAGGSLSAGSPAAPSTPGGGGAGGGAGAPSGSGPTETGGSGPNGGSPGGGTTPSGGSGAAPATGAPPPPADDGGSSTSTPSSGSTAGGSTAAPGSTPSGAGQPVSGGSPASGAGTQSGASSWASVSQGTSWGTQAARRTDDGASGVVGEDRG